MSPFSTSLTNRYCLSGHRRLGLWQDVTIPSGARPLGIRTRDLQTPGWVADVDEVAVEIRLERRGVDVPVDVRGQPFRMTDGENLAGIIRIGTGRCRQNRERADVAVLVRRLRVNCGGSSRPRTTVANRTVEVDFHMIGVLCASGVARPVWTRIVRRAFTCIGRLSAHRADWRAVRTASAGVTIDLLRDDGFEQPFLSQNRPSSPRRRWLTTHQTIVAAASVTLLASDNVRPVAGSSAPETVAISA